MALKTTATNSENNNTFIQAFWRCTFCKTPVYFANQEDFEVHLRVYCHEKNCDEEFTSNLCLIAHHRIRHQPKHEEMFKSVIGRKYQCVGCFEKFAEFQEWCDHVVFCEISWRKMASVHIVSECFGCFKRFPSALSRQRHFLKCEYALSKDAMDTKMTKEAVAKNILDELDLFNTTVRSTKSLTLAIQIPFIQENATTGNLSEIQNRIFRMDNEEPPIGSPSITREKIGTPVANGIKNSRKRLAENTNTDSGNEMATKQPKISGPTLTPLSDGTLFLQSDFNQNEENIPNMRIDSDKTTKEGTTDENFNEKYLQKMLKKYPDIFKKFLLKNRNDIFELMDVEIVEESDEDDELELARNETGGDTNTIDLEKVLESTERWANFYNRRSDKQRSLASQRGTTSSDSQCDNFTTPTPEECLRIRRAVAFQNSKGQHFNLRLERLKLKADNVRVVPVSIPKDWLPYGMKNFNILDAQRGVDSPIQKRATMRPALTSIGETEKPRIFGWLNGAWIDKPTDDIEITIETQDGETSKIRCQSF